MAPRAPLQLLVVEDDPDILEAMSEMLELEGYLVLRARDGHEALKQLESHRPRLILLDLMMPGMDGLTLAARLHERSNTIPIVMISADGHLKRALPPGVSRSLPKPFDIDELLSTVAASISPR